jgi:hypothetical protein
MVNFSKHLSLKGKEKKMGFKFRKELTKKEVFTGGQHLDTSGLYTVGIVKAEIITGKNGSLSEALSLEVKTKEDQIAKFLTIYYLNKKGEELENGYATISQLVELTGNEDHMENFPTCLEKKVVGMVLEVKLGEYNGEPRQERDIKGFYNHKTKCTTKEQIEGLDHETYDFFEDKFKDAKPVPYIKKSNTQKIEDKVNAEKANINGNKNSTADEDDDEFPF